MTDNNTENQNKKMNESKDGKDNEKTHIPPNAETPSSTTSDWWKGFFDAAKNKSAEVLECVVKDLDELSTVVKTEATNIVDQTTSVFKETLQLDKPESTASNMKKSVSSFFGQVSNVLSPSPEDEDEEAVMVQGETVVPLTRLQTQIFALGNEPDTFLKEIEPNLFPQYEAWLEILEENENKEISTEKLIKMLVNNPQLQNNYETLVPNKISHALFWNRYLFRKALLEDEEARQQRKERRANNEDIEENEDDKEKSAWEKDEFNYVEELSEEDQIKLLEDYEREKQSKKSQKKAAKNNEDKSNKKSKDGKKTLGGVDASGAGNLSMREKKDMVIVGDTSTSTTSSTYSSKESTEGDWDKEINMDDVEENVTS